MSTQPEKFHSLDELRPFVKQTLCAAHHLDPEHYSMTESLLLRRGEACGMAFCLHGPRLVRLSAIWAAAEQTLYFYNSVGERFEKVELASGPELRRIAA